MSVIESIIDIPAEHEKKIYGNFDENIKKIERTLHVTIISRDSQIKIIGGEVAAKRAKKVFEQLFKLSLRGNEITEQNVDYALSLSFEDNEQAIVELDDDMICRTAAGKPVKPKTLGQKHYVDEIRKKMIVFGIGPAGTGKTYLAMAMAITALKNDQIMGAESFMHNSEKGIIEVAPLAYMRGRTLDNAFIILDEAQNTTPAQMKMFLTRIGFGSKVIVTGDLTQKDLPRDAVSGLDVALKVLSKVEDISFVNLTNKDVVRHPLVQKIVKAYEEYDEKMAKKKQQREKK